MPCKKEVFKNLECGHVNKYLCNEVSENNECKQQYERKLPCGHNCKRKCRIDCNLMYESDLKKGYISTCKEYVIKTLPCGHEIEIDCGLPVEAYIQKN